MGRRIFQECLHIFWLSLDSSNAKQVLQPLTAVIYYHRAENCPFLRFWHCVHDKRHTRIACIGALVVLVIYGCLSIVNEVLIISGGGCVF